MKRQATDYEKIFKAHISGRVIIFKIHKELLKLDNKKIQ